MSDEGYTDDALLHDGDESAGAIVDDDGDNEAAAADAASGTNCIKIGLPGKSILRDYSQENETSRRPVLLLRISFPGRPIFIQLPPELFEVPTIATLLALHDNYEPVSGLRHKRPQDVSYTG